MYNNNQQVGQAIAATAIPAFTIVQAGSSDGYAAPAIISQTGSHFIGLSPGYAVSALEPFQIVTSGVGQVIAGASITAGDLLTNDTRGYAITLVNTGTIHVHSIGSAIRGAAAGDILPIRVVTQDTLN